MMTTAANGSILRWSFRFLRRFYCTGANAAGGHGDNAPPHGKAELGKLPDRRLYLRFKCGPCGSTIENWLSKQAYDRGVIIVTCDSCKNRHLIADNLGWFPDVDRAKLPKVQEVKLETSASTESATAAVEPSDKGANER